MSFERLTGMILAGMLALPMAATAQGVKKQIAAVKAAKSEKEMAKALTDLGATRAFLDTVLGSKSPENNLKPGSLKRAESFEAELDGDPGKERVSQLIFQGPPDEEGSVLRVYLILVHDEAGGKPALAFLRPFSRLHCGKTDRGGMTFSFAKADARGTRKNVVFKSVVAESCGLQVEEHAQEDTLRFEDGKYGFVEGQAEDESSYDPMNPPE